MIRVQDLQFTYPDADAPAVKGLSFEIGEGEIFGFLGPSGAGKSTTQNVLIGLLQGWSGTIEVMGRPLADWGGDYYRQIGVHFELPNHYLKLTARENLEFFRALYGGDAETPEAVLDLVGLLGDIDKKVGAFSKGMKNRLNFARSLLHRPKIWFLDEPTSGLDPVTAVRIRELITERKAQGMTTFLTTHDMHTADQLCDRVGFIVGGELATIGAPEALRRQYGQREVELRWDDSYKSPAGSARFPMYGLAGNEAFLQALRENEVATIHSQETSLEDVFIQVTGQALK